MGSRHSMDRDHVVLLEKIDKAILAAEGEEVSIGIRKRLYAIRSLMVVHAQKAQGLAEELTNAVTTNRRKILLIGFLGTLSILGPYLLLTRTTIPLKSPLFCQEFKTEDKAYPGELEVCVNGVTRSYSRLNGDAELDITFMRSPVERIQADIVFWIATHIAEQPVDYSGEYNIDRIRTYENGFLVSDDSTKISGWTKPLVPEDVRMPLWQWIKDNKHHLMRDKPPLEERIEGLTSQLGPTIGAIGSIGITIYRFFRV